MDDLDVVGRLQRAEETAAYAQHRAEKLREQLVEVRAWMLDPERKITGLRVILGGTMDWAKLEEPPQNALTIEDRLRELDVWAMTYVESERTWEVTTFERKPGQHWHGRGKTLLSALDDLADLKRKYVDGC